MTDRTSEVGRLQDRLRIAFEREFPIPANTERHLAEALSETLQRSGNFIRAQIAYSVARAHGSPDESSLQLAIALEYFHTASLLFDDLPSMDDATHRRGAMCVHQLYGEGAGILSALGLINRAYALLWQAAAQSAPARQAAALRYVESHLGLGGLAYQALDDLKDVLHEDARAGKTTARDNLLDRPNLALTLGASATIERLQKLVRFSARCVSRLQNLAPSLSCLDIPHQRLELEVAGLAEELVGARR